MNKLRNDPRLWICVFGLLVLCGGATAQPTDLFVVAHQDDDLLFMNPDIQESIEAGRRVVTVYLTAGNDEANDDTRYWQARKQGELAAYAAMAGVPMAEPVPVPWTLALCNETNSFYTTATLEGSGQVVLVFFALNGSKGNLQYPENGTGSDWGCRNMTLERLWKRDIASMSTFNTPLDRKTDCKATKRGGCSSTYEVYEGSCHENVTREMVLAELVELMKTYKPSRISTLDSSRIYYESYRDTEDPWDHTDHVVSALFGLEASQGYRAQLPSGAPVPELRIYRGYNTWGDQPVLLAEEEITRKCEIFGTYAVYDFHAATNGTEVDRGFNKETGFHNYGYNCASTDPSYKSAHSVHSAIPALDSFSASRIVNGAVALTADGAQISLTSSSPLSDPTPLQEWTLSNGTISNGSKCLTGSSPSDWVGLAPCSPASDAQRWTFLANGQIRGPGATCLTNQGALLTAEPCILTSAQAGGTSITSQKWTVWHAAQKLASSYFSDAEGYASDVSYFGSIRLGDINGDRAADVCGRGSAGIWCALNNGVGSFGTQWLVLSGYFDDAQGWRSAKYGATLQLGDIDGDGKADLCLRGPAGVSCSRSTSTASSAAFDVPELWSSEFGDDEGWGSHESYYGTVRLADVNGDGKADLCARGSAGIRCALALGKQGRFGTAQIIGIFSDSDGWREIQYGTTIQFGDLNGDGKADVCGRGTAGLRCALSKSAGTTIAFGFARRWSFIDDFADAGAWASHETYYKSIRLADIDGNGRADVCGRGTAGIWCALSLGSGFGPALNVIAEYADPSWAQAPYGTTISLGDVDKDGRADVCGRGSRGILCAFAP